MKKLLIFALALVQFIGVAAQENEKKFDFKVYGRIRGDLFYNSRANNESVDGLFYMFPLDHKYDAQGEDLNGTAQGSFYMLYTRLGVDIKGPKVGNAVTTAKVEMDFRGSGTTFSVPRLRHAYVNLDFGKSDWLVGQTWHPMTGDQMPSMLNLSTGAPYQPFSRAPLIRYRYLNNGWQLTAATVWQMQYTSPGPDGKSHNYLKNSCIPEIFLGLEHKSKSLVYGVGAELMSLRPRKQNTVDGKVYKISERVTSISAEAHAKYTAKDWNITAKTLLANNMAHASMVGGYAVTHLDQVTGEAEYAPYRHSSTWVNFVYGKKWQTTVFLGYLKNLGTSKEIAGPKYGVGLDLDQVASANVSLSYNLPHWKFGIELEPSVAWYGDAAEKGKIKSNHSVTNFHTLGVMMFIF